MAVTAPNTGPSLLQFTLIQDILTVRIPVVTISTSHVPSHMNFMGKKNRGSLFFLIGSRVFERYLLWLCTENRDHNRHEKTPQSHCDEFPLHVLISLPKTGILTAP